MIFARLSEFFRTVCWSLLCDQLGQSRFPCRMISARPTIRKHNHSSSALGLYSDRQSPVTRKETQVRVGKDCCCPQSDYLCYASKGIINTITVTRDYCANQFNAQFKNHRTGSEEIRMAIILTCSTIVRTFADSNLCPFNNPMRE